MDESITQPILIHTSPNLVRSTIAHTILGPPLPPTTVGTISLYPHQLDALQRIRSAIKDFKGALLCDDVGLGKTYVALALAITYPKTLIVTPAILRTMWTRARDATYVNTPHSADIVSIESLSLHTPPPIYDLIIIDEAHHARNRRTKRYSSLTTLCANAHVLFMSATPIHNSTQDLTTLLSLFLKDRALTLTPHDLSRILIRRTHAQTPLPHSIPHRSPTRWFQSPTTQSLLTAILNLPPPLPPRTAGNTPHLATLALVRQWTSSDYALSCAIRRRIARATAMLHSINAGHYPTPNEIRAWLFNDDSVQLAFPELIAQEVNTPDVNLSHLKTTIQTHTTALTQLLHQIPTPSPADLRKAQGIRRIRAQHPNARIIAFSQYADTIAVLFNILKNDGHIAALTGKGGRIASGPLSRNEIIKRFAPLANNALPSHPREDVTLLLTTDLLSEGINLQDASVILHLDIPWTAATIDQRIGRVARIGSKHPQVTIYGLIPPPEADRILHTTAIIQQKAEITHQTLGGTPIDVPNHKTSLTHQTHISTPEYTEAIRSILREWLHLPTSTIHHNPTIKSSPQQRKQKTPPPHLSTKPHCLVSTLPAHTSGFIAACLINDTPLLLTSTSSGTPTTDPQLAYQALISVHDTKSRDRTNTSLPLSTYRSTLKTILTWFDDLLATSDAGLTHLPPLYHSTTRQTRATLRTLSRTLATAPWTQRPKIAQHTSKIRTDLTHTPPVLTFHLVALLLLRASD
jgi:superfamily II DNA or RNA helicase